MFLTIFCSQVKQKKYEVLEKKHKINGSAGIVTITTVTNSLSAANNNEYNQVHHHQSIVFQYFIVILFQTSELPNGSSLHNRASRKKCKNKVNSELLSSVNNIQYKFSSNNHVFEERILIEIVIKSTHLNFFYLKLLKKNISSNPCFKRANENNFSNTRQDSDDSLNEERHANKEVESRDHNLENSDNNIPGLTLQLISQIWTNLAAEVKKHLIHIMTW